MDGKLMNKVNFEIKKRRYLNQARIAITDKDVFGLFINQINNLSEYNVDDFSLRKTISNTFHLTENIGFRQNTTQVFRDVLDGIIRHKCNRKEEYCNLLLSDIDHPVIKQMATTILPKKNIKECKLINELVIDKTSNERLLNIFLDKIEEFNIKVVLIPHVNWINGAKIDVVFLSKEIKKLHQDIVIIVDGAQALGNIETIIDNNHHCNNDIDFYLSCGHKWIGTPMPVGFTRVSDRFMEMDSFRDYFFLSDYFSGFAGNLKFLDKLAQDTYNIPLSMLFDISIKERKISNDYYSNVIEKLKPLKKNVNNIDGLKVLEPNKKMSTGVLAFTGELCRLQIIHKKLLENYFSNTLELFEINQKKTPFIRISSPLGNLSNLDLNIFNDCLQARK